MKKIKHTSIEHALQDGLKLNGFSSGGRLRVLCLVNDKEKQIYYGEGVDFHSALRILGDDVVAGGRKYKEVYGEGKIEPAYWTGRHPTPGDVMDIWVYQGHGFNVEFDKETNEIVVKLLKKYLVRTPENIVSEVTRRGQTVRWKFVDYDNIYISAPNRGGCSTRSDNKSESDPWYKEIVYEGRSINLSVALTNAFAQTEKLLSYEILK